MALQAKWMIGIVAFIGIVGGLWYWVSYSQSIGAIFFLFSTFGFVSALFSERIARYFNTSATAGNIKYKISSLFLLGLSLGMVPVILSISYGLSIGVPALSVDRNLLIVATVIFAPIVEEIFFLFAVPFWLGRILLPLGPLGWFLNVLASSFIFSIFHWLAYGAVFQVSGPFIVAFAFRALTLVMVSVLSNGRRFYETTFTVTEVGQGLIPAIIMHGMFNTAVVYEKLFVPSEVST